jgi:hypothetical protein
VGDDYPIQHRASGRPKYLVALVVVGGIAVVWALVALISFGVLRLRSTVSSGVIVGYEIAGGRERLRVETLGEGRRRGFMLLETTDAWPRYAEGQHVEVLTWRATNKLGQKVQESMVYAHRNYWQKKVLVFAAGFFAVVAGVVGLVGSRARDKTG